MPTEANARRNTYVKKMAVLLLVLLSMATLTGTVSAKARGMIVFDMESTDGAGVPNWGMPMSPGRTDR